VLKNWKIKRKRKIKRKKRLCCYFVWPLSFNLSGLGGPTRSINFSQHSYPGHWSTQSPHHEKVKAHGGRGGTVMRKRLYQEYKNSGQSHYKVLVLHTITPPIVAHRVIYPDIRIFLSICCMIYPLPFYSKILLMFWIQSVNQLVCDIAPKLQNGIKTHDLYHFKFNL